MEGQQDTHIVPEQAAIAEVPSHAVLAQSIHPSELRAQKRMLDEVTDVQPTEFGGVHDTHANLSGRIDREAIRFVAAELNHVPIETATKMPSGGVHLINNEQDTRVIPEAVRPAVEEGTPANLTLAGAIQPSQLQAEKRQLDHVPLEFQRQTLSGGVHMNDEEARLQPSLFDRVKNALGLEVGLDQTPPELGRVVDQVSPSQPRASGKHLVDKPLLTAAQPPHDTSAEVSETAATSAASSSSAFSSFSDAPSSVPYPQNAYLADHIRPAALVAEHGALTPPHSSHRALSRVVRPDDLQMERGRLHHVNIERVELKRDLNAGVGSVTTRKATSRPTRRGSFSFAEVERAPAAAPNSELVSPKRLPLAREGIAAVSPRSATRRMSTSSSSSSSSSPLASRRSLQQPSSTTTVSDSLDKVSLSDSLILPPKENLSTGTGVGLADKEGVAGGFSLQEKRPVERVDEELSHAFGETNKHEQQSTIRPFAQP